MLERSHHARCRACASSGPRPFVLPGTARVYERARPFEIRHIALDVALDIPHKAIGGTASLDVVRVDEGAKEIALDAVAFEIESVEVGKERVDFVYDGETLRIPIPQELAETTICVRYRVFPKKGLYFLAPDSHVKDRPVQVWSQCQDEDARYWLPCHDKPHIKQSFEIRVAVPSGWQALSNGEELSIEKREDAWVYHFKMDDPLPTYLLTLVAGEFEKMDGGVVDGIPLSYFVPKGRSEDGLRTFSRTPAMLTHFGELTGIRYPWNKYAQIVVSDFTFGGMENTTATTLYEHVLLDERAAIDITSDDLIAHELAHHWFGDYVTCRDFSHGWLNEGFATFFEHLDRELKGGRDEYEYGLNVDSTSYLGEAKGHYRRPIVCKDYEAPIDIFDRHLYEKGGLVLHMLRVKLGDGVFWRGVQTYLKRHAHGVVETRDLLRALEEVSGKSLERFFDEWVHSPGHPELRVHIEHEGELLVVKVEQKQATGEKKPGTISDIPLFAFDLVLEIAEPSGETRREVRRIEAANETFALPQKARPRYVVVDPDFAVLAEIDLEAPRDMLEAQLREAKTARGRWLASGPLGKRFDTSSLDALEESLLDENEFWGTRALAARALGETRLGEAFTRLERGLSIAHPKVRRAVVQALGQFKTEAAAARLQPLALEDASYLVEAEASRSLGKTRQPSAFEVLVDILDRPSWADVIRSGALDGLAALRDERALPHVIARTRYGVNTRGRRAAIRALPKLSSDRKTRETLEDLLDDPDLHLRAEAVSALVDLGDTKSRGALSARLDREDDGRVRRTLKEALRDLEGGPREEQRRLQDEVDALRTKYAELAAKLAKLEASIGAR